ncbi:hypothetical protein LTR37_002044 [Vermiconidia calcicola]|uniref:Uncharacterized protein n=1 Tax=Vermiconidia calcicola TaxID=1690605 RepID=A0ACC3NTH7_9PEZI|nr:hypothetical protein LTR37_002044 [Vermiconidia calcicola]
MRNQLWRSLRRSPHLQYQLRYIADARPFQPGDLVLLREKLRKSAQPIFTRPLKAGGRIEGHRGIIPHDDIIGKRVRDVVRTAPPKQKPGVVEKKRQEQTEFRLHEVKLEEYRLVTPVYPADAALIVDLLDLHSHAHDAVEGGEKLEVLEAGTGHGALTLYLSRAIHAANLALPPHFADEASAETWKANRKAVIHTIDTQAKYSAHAQSIVKGFKHGIYAHNVDFYTSDVSAWVRKTLHDDRHAGNPFLSHTILDLPNADMHLATVAQAMQTDGMVVVFNPSLTQILQCCAKIKEEGMPLELESVIELPVNGGARGREWDVRAAKPRASVKKEDDSAVVQGETGVDEDLAGTEEQDDGSLEAADVNVDADLDARVEHTPEKEGGWQMVCRPKVGDRIVGGGFLGVFKKQRDMRQEA